MHSLEQVLDLGRIAGFAHAIRRADVLRTFPGGSEPRHRVPKHNGGEAIDATDAHGFVEDQVCFVRCRRRANLAHVIVQKARMVGAAGGTEGAAAAATAVTALAIEIQAVATSDGPVAGGGAKLGNLKPGDITRIQNAVNRTRTEVTVVGSRANGTAKATSDWDYAEEDPTQPLQLASRRTKRSWAATDDRLLSGACAS